MSTFTFLNPGHLQDGDLTLRLVKMEPADPTKGWVPQYHFALVVNEKVAGNIRFRAQNSPFVELYGGHIGYDVDPAFRGNHYAERACRLILPLAKQHGFTTLVFTCNPDNVASYRTIERLGATYHGIIEVPLDHPVRAKGETTKRRYVLAL